MTTPMINAWRACQAREAMLVETDETEDGAEHAEAVDATRAAWLHAAKDLLDEELPKGVDIDECEVMTWGDLDRYDADYTDDTPVAILPGWSADDGNQKVYYPLADSGGEAARLYVDGGDWGEPEETSWVKVYTWRRVLVLEEDGTTTELCMDRDSYSVAIEPDEPECTEDEHDWDDPHDVVGGCESNPGVYCHGGGVVMRYVCAHCGRYMVIDTWAQDRTTGQQGLRGTSYEDADETSMAWVMARRVSALRHAMRDLYDIDESMVDGDRVTIPIETPSVDDDYYDDRCDEIIAEIRDALPEGWEADWSGNGNGDTEDVRIEYTR